MTFCLDSVMVKPETNKKIKNAIILLHGYGGDGKDISMLSLNWKRHLPNTIFICPNGHEPCSINPNGYQWFDLSKDDPVYILDQSIKAEKKLSKFIDEIKNEFNFENKQICLSGFSQGCMMSLNVGLTSEKNFNSIVGFSGKIIEKNDLASRITSTPEILLIHGNLDEIVSPNNLLDAKDFLLRQKINVQTMMIENCGHNIPIEASSAALNFIKKNIVI